MQRRHTYKEFIDYIIKLTKDDSELTRFLKYHHSEYLLSQTILNRNYSSIAALVHYGAHTYPGALLKCISAISVVSSFMAYGHTRLMLNMIESLVDGTISSKCLNKFTQILTSDLYINPVMTTEHTFTFDLFISLI